MILRREIIGLDFAPPPPYSFVSFPVVCREYPCTGGFIPAECTPELVVSQRLLSSYRAERCCQNVRMLRMVAAPRFHLSATNPTRSVVTGFASSVGGVLLTCIFLIHSFSNRFCHALLGTRLLVCAGSRQHTCWPSPFWQSRVRIV